MKVYAGGALKSQNENRQQSKCAERHVLYCSQTGGLLVYIYKTIHIDSLIVSVSVEPPMVIVSSSHHIFVIGLMASTHLRELIFTIR